MITATQANTVLDSLTIGETEISIEANGGWSPEAKAGCPRYEVVTTADGEFQDAEGFDDLEAAEAYAAEVLGDLEREAEETTKGEAEEAVAALIGDGKAAAVLAALKAAGLI